LAEETLCPRCSAANPRGTGFCGRCGAGLAGTTVAEAQPDPLIGALIDGRFLVTRKLGEGGMGVVYEAEQTAFGRRIALKVLHPHVTDKILFARFRNEAATASRLDHPNTITVFDFGETETGSLYIAMELVSGASLDAEIRRGGALEWRRAARIVRQICGSLANAHEKGIVHRDLKPENVMLLRRDTERDFVKVLDFGIAKIMEDDGTDQRQALTKTGMVLGTPQYMSPEQIRGEKVDARSDIYSTGVIVYQMLTGAPPFSSATPMGLLTKHLTDQPPPFAQMNPTIQVPPELERLVMQMLAKAAVERPQTMREVAERIDAVLLKGGSAKTVVMDAAVAKRKGKGGMIVGIALGAVLLLGGGAVAAWYFTLGPGSSAPGVATPSTPIPEVPQQPIVTPQAQQPVQAPVAENTDTSLGSLQAVPDGTPSKPGQPNRDKIPPAKAKRCSFSAGEDGIGRAVRDALKDKEPQIRLCARDMAGEAAAKFSFSVAANAKQVSEVAETTATGLETCLKPYLAVSIVESDAAARTGNVTIAMKGKGGVESCKVQVLTQKKSAARKPRLPFELGKNQDELVSTAKESWSQLKKKLEDMKKGSTEADTDQ
jgi:tRNA A-37 threonylcarbamoyl transferase component Bud32